jgi:hypothetical protein
MLFLPLKGEVHGVDILLFRTVGRLGDTSGGGGGGGVVGISG